MVSDLVEQRAHMVVVKPVEDRLTVAAGDYEAKVAEDPKLLRGSRPSDTGCLGEVADVELAAAKGIEQAHARRCRQRLHRLGDRLGRLSIGRSLPVLGVNVTLRHRPDFGAEWPARRRR